MYFAQLKHPQEDIDTIYSSLYLVFYYKKYTKFIYLVMGQDGTHRSVFILQLIFIMKFNSEESTTYQT